MFEQGEIYICDFEAAGIRPAVVVSCEPLNRGDELVVVPFTTQGVELAGAFRTT